MGAIPTLDLQCCGFGAQGAGTDDDAWYADQVRDIYRRKPSNGRVRDGGMNEQLMFWKRLCGFEVFRAARGVQNALCTDLESSFELRKCQIAGQLRLISSHLQLV